MDFGYDESSRHVCAVSAAGEVVCWPSRPPDCSSLGSVVLMCSAPEGAFAQAESTSPRQAARRAA